MRNSLFGRAISGRRRARPAGGRVEPEVAAAEDRVDASRAGGGRGRAGGRQLGEGEGFDQIVVGAGVEPGDAVGDGVAGGQQQDRGLHPPPPRTAGRPRSRRCRAA